MIRRIIISFAAIAAIFVAGITSASAQTAGTSTLEQIGYLMKGTYAFGLNPQGSSLSLRQYSNINDVITLSIDGSNEVIMQTVLGDLSSLSTAGKSNLQETIFFLNTRLPVGTIMVEESGVVKMQHRLNTSLVPVVRITEVINRFSAEAARQRAQLFA